MTKKWLKNALDQLCQDDLEFARHWLGLSNAGKHVVAFAWVANTRLTENPIKPRVLAQWLRSHRRNQALKTMVGEVPAGFVTGLRKVKGTILSQQRYLDLWELYHDDNARKVLHHLKTIGEFQVRVLLALEPAYARYSIVRRLKDRESLSTALLAIRIVQSQRPDLTDLDISHSLGTCLNADGSISDWLNRLLKKVEFPSPPWPGTNRLIPVANHKQVAACAEEFNNCLVDEINSVLCGQRYFYHWSEDRGAIVAFENDSFLGWVVGEIKGKNNNRVPNSVLRKIELVAKCSGYTMVKDYDEARINLLGCGIPW